MAQAQLTRRGTSCPKRSVRFPCLVCDKACGVDTIQCSECASWVHRQCVLLTTQQFNEFSVDNITFRCRRCARDTSGAAFNYLASLNRYTYLFLYIHYILRLIKYFSDVVGLWAWTRVCISDVVGLGVKTINYFSDVVGLWAWTRVYISEIETK